MNVIKSVDFVDKSITENDDFIKNLIEDALERGYITYNSINKALPKDFNFDLLDLVYNAILDKNIEIIDDIESEQKNSSQKKVLKNESTTDPMKLYMSSLASIKVLTREEEVELSKKICDSNQKITELLCNIPIAMNHFIKLADDIDNNTCLLREVFEVEVLYNESFKKLDPEKEKKINISTTLKNANARLEYQTILQEKISQIRSLRAKDKEESSLDDDFEEEESSDDSLDFETESSIPFAIMESALRSKLKNQIDIIANLCLSLLKLNKDRLNKLDINEEKYESLLLNLVNNIKNIRLHNNVINQILLSLKDIQSKLTSYELSLFNLIDVCKIDRNLFHEYYKKKDFYELASQDLFQDNLNAFQSLIVDKKEDFQKICHEVNLLIKKEILVPIPQFKAFMSKINTNTKVVTDCKKYIIESNLRLVVSIAKKYFGKGSVKSNINNLDLIQEGCIGLQRAIDRYAYSESLNINTQIRFSTYATPWIKQSVSRASAAAQSNGLCKPPHASEAENRIQKTIRLLKKKLDRSPSIQEIARYLNTSVQKVKKIIKIAKDPISAETPVGDAVIGDFIKDETSSSYFLSPISTAIDKNNHSFISTALLQLTPREERVIRLRFGISPQDSGGELISLTFLNNATSDQTLEEVGKSFCVTRERVRQIEAKALRKLQRIFGDGI